MRMRTILKECMLSLSLLALSPFGANAAEMGTGGGLPYETWLMKLQHSTSGPVAFSIAVISIIVSGATLIFGGDLNHFFRSLIFLVLVMALIVSANSIMGQFFGVGAEIPLGAGL